MMRGQIGGPLDELSEHKLHIKESADYPALPPKINAFVARLAQPNYQLAQG
jgi:ubiquitin-protein ligase